MQWRDSAETLYRIASWLTVATFATPLLFGILTLFVQNRARQLETVVIDALRSTNKQLEERTRERSLNPTPETLTALRTNPRGQLFTIIDSYDSETVDYGAKWRQLLEGNG